MHPYIFLRLVKSTQYITFISPTLLIVLMRKNKISLILGAIGIKKPAEAGF